MLKTTPLGVEDEMPTSASSMSLAANGGADASPRWMQRYSTAHIAPPFLNANQRTSIAAMIAYISSQSGKSEMYLERKLSDHFNVPNSKCIASGEFDSAICYLADIISL
jgi:hypothetical protein